MFHFMFSSHNSVLDGHIFTRFFVDRTNKPLPLKKCKIDNNGCSVAGKEKLDYILCRNYFKVAFITLYISVYSDNESAMDNKTESPKKKKKKNKQNVYPDVRKYR